VIARVWAEQSVLGEASAAMQKRKIEGLFPLDRSSRVADRHNVASRHETRERQSGGDPALVFALPSVSGDECARALERCGLRRCDEAAGVVWMEQGASFVCVPLCSSLPQETLDDILATSGLSRRAFLAHLGRSRALSAN